MQTENSEASSTHMFEVIVKYCPHHHGRILPTSRRHSKIHTSRSSNPLLYPFPMTLITENLYETIKYQDPPPRSLDSNTSVGKQQMHNGFITQSLKKGLGNGKSSERGYYTYPISSP